METKPVIVSQCCSKCQENKPVEEFHARRKVCKGCRKKLSAEKYQRTKERIEKEINVIQEMPCSKCQQTKPISSFSKCKTFCKDCNNEHRRKKYQENPELRRKLIQSASSFKSNKALEMRKKKEEELGIGNKKCRFCLQIKPSEKFRHNRLKCRDCERDDPKQKFNRAIRSRIYLCLKKKSSHTIEYLGCSYEEYHEWILNHNYNMENRSYWHIDHVIPLSNFNLDNKEEQLLAFNWRNTTPLPCKENLAKNKRIDKAQLEQHWNKLVEYHEKKNITIPQVFVELFMQRNQIAGTP